MSKLSPSELLDLIPLYALDALPDAEHEQVESLLAQYSEAQNLLRQYQQLIPLLTLSVAHRQAPTHLKSRLMAKVQEDKTAHNTPSTPPSKVMLFMKRLLPVAVILTMIIGAVIVYLMSSSPIALYQQIIANTESRRIAITAYLNTDIHGELVILPDGSQAVFRVESLPPLDSTQAFQIWLVDENGPRSGGIYRFDQTDTQYIALPLAKSAYDYQRFGMSLEPATGSPLKNRPSGLRVFDVTLQPSE